MKTMVTCAFFFFNVLLFATAQVPDYIIYDGKEYPLFSNPLEKYFKEHPEKRPKSGLRTTALYRGYVATFEIKDKKLTLKDIYINKIVILKNMYIDFSYRTRKSVKKEVLSKAKDSVLHWFSGILVIPLGKLVHYVHMGYGSTYERYILLEIKDGVLTGKKDLTAKEYQIFKEVQFSNFKKTDQYKKIFKKLKSRKRSAFEDFKSEDEENRFLEELLRSFVIEYTSEFLDKE